jgi:hypothetical protein
MIGGALTGPFVAVITTQMKRIEGAIRRWPIRSWGWE